MGWLNVDDEWYEWPWWLEPDGDAPPPSPRRPRSWLGIAEGFARRAFRWVRDRAQGVYRLLTGAGDSYTLDHAGLLGYSRASLQGCSIAIAELAALVADGSLAIATWFDAMQEELRGEFIRQYILGRGGRDLMTPRDWGIVGRMLRDQYAFLRGFRDAIADGLLSEAQIRARAELYARAAFQAFARGEWEAMLLAGKAEVRWVLNPAAENCPDCIEFDGWGWCLMADDPYGGAVPRSGDTQCLTNCQCELEYR